MNTAWGEIAVRDAHVHFLSDRFFATLARQKGASISAELSALGFTAPETDPVLLAGQWAEVLDSHGVESAVLIASVPGDESSVINAVGAFPERFHGFFMVDPTQPDAGQRLKAALEGGMRGICFFPAMHRYSMHDQRVSQLLESLAGRTGIVAFVHCGVLSVGIRAKLGLDSHFDMRFSNPLDVHELALRFSHLSFVIPHFGAGYFREALMLADLCPNVYLDTSSSNGWTKYHAPALELRDVFRTSLAVLGAHRLLFGTDSSFFPRGWHRQIFDSQANLLADIGVGADNAAMIFGGNLHRLLV